MQMRYLETLVSMSKSAGTKVIFMPGEATATGMSGMGGKGKGAALMDVVTSQL